jgi:hypothetical protein
MSGRPIPLPEILERDWDRQLFAGGRKPGLATQLGWRSHWTFNSQGSAHGFPDRTVVRDRLIVVELKRELTGKRSEDANRQPTAMQIDWLDALARAGVETYLWRPSDLDEIARILGKRWTFMTVMGSPGLVERAAQPELWQPRSLWIPGLGRADTSDQQTLLERGAAAAQTSR